MLNKILYYDKSYDEMRTSFVEDCVKFNDVFNGMYRLVQPENADMVSKIEKLTNSVSDLRDQEADLFAKLLSVRKEKREAQEQLKNCLLKYAISFLLLLLFFVFF